MITNGVKGGKIYTIATAWAYQQLSAVKLAFNLFFSTVNVVQLVKLHFFIKRVLNRKFSQNIKALQLHKS